ncbi:hypothetical protein [Paraburkholderia phenoliruptrix]|uniref:Uncharacterized protein n=2 Tax=Paraburkholderia phenoliruptrix TaxID=252970 RepID=K0DUY8_9BURK|nr:hypothetical protein [Paraburkholderia phenoliruptrix]AFT90061.1 hypothetical protein BUPH_08236 [Paraburkholderia phenoliruptrix BR3459a]CAB4052526.1 hypothetical protein LMG9964_06216 [Paraburkholderia phenoliruptrix]
MKSEVYRFVYTRSEGLKRSYDVTINVARLDSGIFTYVAWVHHEGAFKGNGLVFPLTSSNADDAATEARSRIEDDIEQLAGVAE